MWKRFHILGGASLATHEAVEFSCVTKCTCWLVNNMTSKMTEVGHQWTICRKTIIFWANVAHWTVRKCVLGIQLERNEHLIALQALCTYPAALDVHYKCIQFCGGMRWHHLRAFWKSIRMAATHSLDFRKKMSWSHFSQQSRVLKTGLLLQRGGKDQSI